ncbi:MAG: efflux transporter periplasmic adaptor subunit [Cellvibrionaceae bacterium]|nr:efflux transporter periplasmic adaptor subunit [Cellvibrionaceae bacterium]
MVIGGPDGSNLRHFPGRIDSANKAELSFRVPGKVEKLLVNEGEFVTKGQTLAQLDRTDYRITMKDRAANYEQAKKDFERGEELVVKGSISRRDYDTLKAKYKSADAALEQAQQNLNYTTLKAPFAGSIARRHIEQFEEIATKQSVLSIIDQDSLLVKFDIPESLILQLPQGTEEDQVTGHVSVWARFDSSSDSQFELIFKEVSKRADAKTQTFEITYSLPQQKEITVLPGMTANVTIDFSEVLNDKPVHFLPLSAISGSNELEPRVWRIDEQTMTVKEQKIAIGRMLGSKVEVTNGVQSGMRIVTAGAAFLSEDMKVSLIKPMEQAEPRNDTPSNIDQQ